MSGRFHVPILFLIFNRLSTEQQVFDQIKKIKPCKLYISADGPRDYVDGEKELCDEARSIINQIDWDCDVHTRFLDENLGCAKAISSGITWFFNQEPEGIILEDDCVPHPDFFPYCALMLEKYRENPEVMMITGDNRGVSEKYTFHHSYDFSRWAWIWGWASWAQSWNKYDIALNWWKSNYNELLYDPYLDVMPLFREEALYIGDMYSQIHNPDTWDAQWALTVFINHGLCIVPRENLISNIGGRGVHFSSDKSYPALFREMDTFDFDNLISPKKVIANQELDRHLHLRNVSRKYLLALKIGSIGRQLHIYPSFQRVYPIQLYSYMMSILKKGKKLYNSCKICINHPHK